MRFQAVSLLPHKIRREISVEFLRQHRTEHCVLSSLIHPRNHDALNREMCGPSRNISISENENAKGHISRESIVYEMAHQVRDLEESRFNLDITKLILQNCKSCLGIPLHSTIRPNSYSSCK